MTTPNEIMPGCQGLNSPLLCDFVHSCCQSGPQGQDLPGHVHSVWRKRDELVGALRDPLSAG